MLAKAESDLNVSVETDKLLSSIVPSKSEVTLQNDL